jgi:hypothetical protein
VFLHLDRIEIKNKPHDGLLNAKFYMGPWTNADDVARDIVTFEMKPGGYDIPYEPPTGIQREPILRVDNRGSLVSDTGTNLEPWRLSLSYYKVDWRVKLLRNPPSVLRKALRFVPAKWLVPRPIEVHSEWINGPPELMPVATKTTNTPPK